MGLEQLDSPTADEYSSRERGGLNYSGEYKTDLDLDSNAGDTSCGNGYSSYHGGSCASDSMGLKGADLSDSYTALSSSSQRCPRDYPRVVKPKSIRDLECEESLRRLHSLAVGDSVYFRRVVLGISSEGNPSKLGNYLEGRVVCFSFDKYRRYVVITLDGYGFLKFMLGDLYRMAVDKNICLQRLQQQTSLIKSMKQKRQRLDYEDEYLSRRGSTSHLGNITEESDATFSRDETNITPIPVPATKKSQSSLEQVEVRARPVPPGVETFCKCRFINKVDLVRKLRTMIHQNKQYFYEKTACMQELRLIMTQNIRAYELEMVSYLMNEDPWNHSANPYERPTEEGVKSIIEQYKEAVCSKEYITLFGQWQKYQKALKQEAKVATAASAQGFASNA